MQQTQHLNKQQQKTIRRIQQVRKRYQSIAKQYNTHDAIFRELALRLLKKVQGIKIEPKWILDLGSGTGYLTGLLQKNYPQANVLATDLSEAMMTASKIQQAAQPFSQSSTAMQNNPFSIVSCIEALPLKPEKFDLILMNATLPWCTSNYSDWFEIIQGCLKNEGYFLFSTLGPDTLFELKIALQQAKKNTLLHFLDMHHFADLLLAAQFSDAVVDKEYLEVRFENPSTLLEDLAGIGSPLLPANLSQRKKYIQNYSKILENNYPKQDNAYPVTLEIIYGHARKQSQKNKKIPRSYNIALKDIKGIECVIPKVL